MMWLSSRLTVVSNPLGWDGDLRVAGRNENATAVSNPLGWDGDLGSRDVLDLSAASF